MADRAAQRVATRYLASVRVKTAGEVRFIKDRGGNKDEWGWSNPGPSAREIKPSFKFDPRHLKVLAKCLRATAAARGFALSAYDAFSRIKSVQISPDGNLGGKGYIQKITEMRRQFMNSVEALASLSDTLYDEVHAPHWDPAIQAQSARERAEVRDIMQDVETIRDDPEGWAEAEEAEMDEEGEVVPPARPGRKASVRRIGGDKWDTATHWFDAELEKLTTGKALRDFFAGKIRELLGQVAEKSGIELKNPAEATKDVLDRMFPMGGALVPWVQVADNFWLNSFYHFNHDAAARVAMQYLLGRAR